MTFTNQRALEISLRAKFFRGFLELRGKLRPARALCYKKLTFMNEETLSRRKNEILRDLVREYIRTGKPVGSRRLAAFNREGISPASIRTVVAELERAGFVSQPHTSAGRVPTAKGYSLYVNSLIRLTEVSGLNVNWIRNVLETETDPAHLMNQVSQILANLSDQVGFMVAPPLSGAPIRQIEFLKLSPHRVLAILVSQSGLVQNRLLRVEDAFSQQELDAAGKYLTGNYAGETLAQIRANLIQLMSEDKARYDSLLKSIIVLGSAGLMREGSGEFDVYLGGTTTMLGAIGERDLDQLTMLFHAFERKNRLVRIVNACIGDEDGTHVTIGLEDHFPGGRDFSLVSSSYSWGQGRGTLGVLGPRRMEYDKAISVVDCVARLCCQVMGAAGSQGAISD